MPVKISLLTLPAKKANEAAIGQVFLAQPDSEKEELAGKLFAVITVNHHDKKESEAVIDFIIEEATKGYYQDEKIMLRQKMTDLKIENILEGVLVKVNKSLNDFLEEYKIKIDSRQVDATIGVIYNNELHFSNVGDNHLLLAYQKGENFKILNLNEEEDANRAPSKFFSDLLSGQIPENAIFMVLSKDLPEYVMQKEIIKLVSEENPLEAVEILKGELSKVNSLTSFFALIAKNADFKTIEYHDRDSAHHSISQLNKIEEKTERILSSAGLINIKKTLQHLIEKIKSLLPQKHLSSLSNIHKRISPQHIIEKSRHYTNNIKVDRQALKKHSQQFFSLCKNCCSIIKNLVLIVGRFLNPQNIVKKSKQISAWFKRIDKRAKILFLALILIVSLFIIKVSLDNTQKQKELVKKNNQETLDLIDRKENQIESFLLYENETGAEAIIKETKELVKKLPSSTPAEIKRQQDFLVKLQEQEERVQHIIRVDNTTTLADFSSISGATPTKMLFETGKLYLNDSAAAKVYEIKVADPTINPIELKDGSIKYFALDEKKIYMLGQKQVAILDTKNNEVEYENIDLPTEMSVKDMEAYNTSVYLLDNNQIHRFLKRQDKGYSIRREWLNNPTFASSLSDLSIDGDIYATKNGEQIIRLFKGEEDPNFAMGPVSPALSGVTKVLALEKNIYVLEAENKRLVVFSKEDRQFLAQYKLDKFTDIKDVTANETDKKLFILSGDKVYEIGNLPIKENKK